MNRKPHSRFHIKTSRRGFLGKSACASLGATGLAGAFQQLQLMNAAANVVPIGNDYKALVCVFLRGGCDMNNLLVPVAGNSQKAAYVTDRGIAKVPETVAEQGAVLQATIDGTVGGPDTYINTPASVGEPFGLHPSCKNMKTMFNAGELGFVANVGTLSEPVTPANYNDATLPVQLFSHSDQVAQTMAGSAPEKPFTSGWAGRIADLVNSTVNPGSLTSMLITAAGNNSFMSSPGGSIPQYSVTTTGAVSIVGYGPNTDPYVNAIVPATGKYTANNTGRRLRAFEDIMLFNHAHIIEQGYNSIVKRARENEALIGDALKLTTVGDPAYIGVDLDAIFTSFGVAATSNIGAELKVIARLIAGRKCLGNTRQVFFCDQGGYDTHQNINNDQPALLADLDRSLGAFNEAMKQIAAADADLSYNDIVTFQASDFNRTWTPNGSDFLTSGTDHAWGTNTFVFGGPVNGGDFFGTFPMLAVGGPDDVPQGSRGRWIPTTAVDQYSAVLAEWFGVAPGDLDTIFENRQNFETDPALSNLEFIDFLAV